jgi:hypothetical protein
MGETRNAYTMKTGLYTRKSMETAHVPYNTRHGAGDETRTRDPQLGRLMLYQLSYSRICWYKYPAAIIIQQQIKIKKT